jgi:hypothetical protein
VSQAIETVIHSRSEDLVEKAIELAMAGDTNMLRALLATMVPVRRDRPIEFELPPIATAADCVAASARMFAECAAGNLSPSEAREVMGLIAIHQRTLDVAELAELEKRLGEMEKIHAKRR